MIHQAIITTLKLQPVVVLFSCVSICSKLAAKQLPADTSSLSDFIVRSMTNWRLILLLGLMVFLLGIYPFIGPNSLNDSSLLTEDLENELILLHTKS